MNQNKLKIIETIDKMQNELLTLSHQIHDHPELGFQEHQAVGFIRTFLKGHGFEVETPYCGLDTSFKAVKKGKHADRESRFSQNMMPFAESATVAVTILLRPVLSVHFPVLPLSWTTMMGKSPLLAPLRRKAVPVK